MVSCASIARRLLKRLHSRFEESSNIARRGFASVLLGSAKDDVAVEAAETDGSDSAVTCIRTCKLPNGALGVAAGDEDGVIRLWDAK
jgi:hypothetical protein